MHFASSRQLIAIALVWAALLVGYEQHTIPRSLRAYWVEFIGGSTRPVASAASDRPHLKLSMPHLCCSGCLDDLRAALLPLHWLGTPQVVATPPSIEQANASPQDTAYANQLDLDITDLASLDFLALDRALRDAGLSAEKIEVSGIGHFGLLVELPHLCCTVCSTAADAQLERLLKLVEQGRWLDSMTVNKVKKTVTVYARLNAVVDVVDLTTALARAGFYPRSIRVATGPES
jgi:hypothetical protein